MMYMVTYSLSCLTKHSGALVWVHGGVRAGLHRSMGGLGACVGRGVCVCVEARAIWAHGHGSYRCLCVCVCARA